MEVRGLGVINIRDLFGVAATRISKRVELVVQLERWDPAREYDRLGLDDTALRPPRRPGAADPACRWRPGAAWRSSSKSRRATSCCAPAAGMPRATWPRGSIRRLTRLDVRARRRSRRGRRARGRREEAAFEGAPRGCAEEAGARGTRRFVILTGPVRVGKDAGHPRARGPRLLLRRQPADAAHSDDGASCRRATTPASTRSPSSSTCAKAASSSQFPRDLPAAARRSRRVNPTLIFLEASHSALVRRFSETRRPHPLAPDRSVTEGITEEREKLNAIRCDGRPRSSTRRT